MYLFDMDGTLIDSNGVWKNVDREFLSRRGLAYTHAYYEGVAHTIFPLAAKFTKEFCHFLNAVALVQKEFNLPAPLFIRLKICYNNYKLKTAKIWRGFLWV